MLVLSVTFAVIIGTLGWFGFATGDWDAGQRVEATVVTGLPCGQRGTETVSFQQDGTQRQARFDGCGHQQGELVQVRVPSAADPVVHAADATTGDDNRGRGLGLLLFTVSAIVSAGYGLLLQPKGTPRRLLGPLRPVTIRRRR